MIELFLQLNKISNERRAREQKQNCKNNKKYPFFIFELPELQNGSFIGSTRMFLNLKPRIVFLAKKFPNVGGRDGNHSQELQTHCFVC